MTSCLPACQPELNNKMPSMPTAAAHQFALLATMSCHMPGIPTMQGSEDVAVAQAGAAAAEAENPAKDVCCIH